MSESEELPFYESALSMLDADDSRISDIKPSAWAEKRRFMTSDVSSFVGPYSYDRTPYFKEIVDRLHPADPAKKIAFMKSAQIGASTGVIENGIGYIISEQPGPIFLLTATQTLSKISAETKIDQMIKSCGLSDYIRPNVIKKKNQRTGDTARSKEFSGGMLLMGETGNHKNIRQVSMRYGFIDDFEAAPRSSVQSGDTMTLIEQRFASYADKMKIFYISTPEVKATSNIEPAFLMGDQRLYFVPCPKCGEYITLEWKTRIEGSKELAGIYYKIDDNNRLVEGSVGYICQCCGNFFRDGHKYEMNLHGEWRPTAEPSEPNFVSYHLNALYAAPGMYDWEHYVRQYLNANPVNGDKDIEKEKTFYNLVLGQPYNVKGKSPDITRLSQNTRSYEVGTIPVQLSKADGNGEIVLITCACDLNGKEDDARIDYEVVAWSQTGASYSIDHGSIGTFIPKENSLKKRVDRQRWSYEYYAQNSVWPVFLEILRKEYPTDDGHDHTMKIMISGVDCGYHTMYAYDFIDKSEGNGVWVLGLKGKNTERFRTVGLDTPIFREAKERDNLYLVEVNQIKDELVPIMNLRWNEREGVAQPIDFMNFPTPSKGKYTYKSFFSHFEAEEKRLKKNSSGQVIGMMWEKKNSAVMNHHFDVSVYNKSLKEIFSTIACKEMGIKYPSWKAYVSKILGEE